ncbi:MAG: hypothetical protein ACFFCH_07080 [Promethearchaeota archaeon]
MNTDTSSVDSIDFNDEEPSRRRQAIGCCAIFIIIIFVIALFVGYSTWFTPVLP